MTDKNAVEKLKKSIESIQSHRGYEARRAAEESCRVDAAWEAVLTAARDLRTQLRENPMLRYFVIALNQSEVSVSFRRDGGRTSSLLSLYRRHPEGKFPAINAVWILEPGKEDRYVSSSDDAIEALVQHCAANMTRDDE